MNPLLTLTPQTFGEHLETQSVNARELHEFLEVQTRFNDWIASRITEYDFVENQDFITFTENSVKPSREGTSGSNLCVLHRSFTAFAKNFRQGANPWLTH